MSELDRLLAYIRGILPKPTGPLPQSDDRYRSLPLCVIDAVYSIGVRYESTEKAVANFCAWSCWSDDQEYTTKEFIQLLDRFNGNWETVATEVFQNRQRTSSRSGILKAEAVYRFAEQLRRYDIDCLAHLAGTDPNKELVSAITAIRGQSSGISFKYFLMLAGYDGIIKPDRMVERFVANALGREQAPKNFEKLVLDANEVLRGETPQLTAAMLDYEIWRYQRNRPARVAPANPSSNMRSMRDS